MNILEILKLSIENLLSFKFRSFLTMLGIIMGISSVVLLSSLGAGFQAKILDDTNSSIDRIVSVSLNKKYANIGKIKLTDYLKTNDENKIEKISGIETAHISKQVSFFEPTTNSYVIVDAVTDKYYGMYGKKILTGTKFLDKNTSGVIISKNTAKRLFGNKNPIGLSVTLNNLNGSRAGKFTVMGIFKGNFDEAADIFGSGVALEMLMPLNLVNRLDYNNLKIYSTLNVKVKDKKNMKKEIELLKSYLKTRGSKDDIYTVSPMSEELKHVTGILDKFALFINLVASIAIIVGGIGVMNIMLVSVKERITEIGLRKAIGAKNRDIKWQFLIETMILTVIGGLIGILLGYSLALLIGYFIKIFPVLKLDVVMISLIISSLTGLIFGIYPASVASKLSPMEALRKE